MAHDDTELHVLIGMPSFRGSVTTLTLSSIVRLTVLFNESGIRYSFLNVDAAEIVQVRNNIATHVLNERRISHLLFLDDDMVFEPDAILDLLRSDKPIAGLVCPKRSLDILRFHASAAAGHPLPVAVADATDFVVRHISFSTVTVEHGWFQLAGIGMGITLIRRDVLEEMVRAGCVETHRLRDGQIVDSHGNTHHYGFFDPLFSEETGTLLSEDLSFCERWRRFCKGEVWANAAHEVGHVGPMNYRGTYLDRLKTGRP